MNVLGINCATEKICVAFLKGDTLTEKTWDGQTIKAENLLLFIIDALYDAGSCNAP